MGCQHSNPFKKCCNSATFWCSMKLLVRVTCNLQGEDLKTNVASGKEHISNMICTRIGYCFAFKGIDENKNRIGKITSTIIYNWHRKMTSWHSWALFTFQIFGTFRGVPPFCWGGAWGTSVFLVGAPMFYRKTTIETLLKSGSWKVNWGESQDGKEHLRDICYQSWS